MGLDDEQRRELERVQQPQRDEAEAEPFRSGGDAGAEDSWDGLGKRWPSAKLPSETPPT
jgi:hypothetical protein